MNKSPFFSPNIPTLPPLNLPTKRQDQRSSNHLPLPISSPFNGFSSSNLKTSFPLSINTTISKSNHPNFSTNYSYHYQMSSTEPQKSSFLHSPTSTFSPSFSQIKYKRNFDSLSSIPNKETNEEKLSEFKHPLFNSSFSSEVGTSRPNTGLSISNLAPIPLKTSVSNKSRPPSKFPPIETDSSVSLDLNQNTFRASMTTAPRSSFSGSSLNLFHEEKKQSSPSQSSDPKNRVSAILNPETKEFDPICTEDLNKKFSYNYFQIHPMRSTSENRSFMYSGVEQKRLNENVIPKRSTAINRSRPSCNNSSILNLSTPSTSVNICRKCVPKKCSCDMYISVKQSTTRKEEKMYKEPDTKCKICFELITERGELNCCQHEFCFNCIHQWSKTSNTCPFCKREFNALYRKPTIYPESLKNRPPFQTIKIASKKQTYSQTIEETQQIIMASLQDFIVVDEEDEKINKKEEEDPLTKAEKRLKKAQKKKIKEELSVRSPNKNNKRPKKIKCTSTTPPNSPSSDQKLPPIKLKIPNTQYQTSSSLENTLESKLDSCDTVQPTKIKITSSVTSPSSTLPTKTSEPSEISSENQKPFDKLESVSSRTRSQKRQIEDDSFFSVKKTKGRRGRKKKTEINTPLISDETVPKTLDTPIHYSRTTRSKNTQSHLPYEEKVDDTETETDSDYNEGK